MNVVVVGAGNAGMCAAISALENGADVTILERAPREHRGGNTAYTAGAMRVKYDGVEDLKRIMPDLTATEIQETDFGQYTEQEFFFDMARVTQYKSDPDLVERLVKDSLDTLEWMTTLGVRFGPIYGRQAYKVDGKFKFWGGLTAEVSGGGMGLVDALFDKAESMGAVIRYQARARRILREDGKVVGVEVEVPNGGTERIYGDSVILAAGGFQANAEWRARYLGPGWDLAKVRGTRFNTGDGIAIGLEAGASAAGHWSGCHAVAWDLNAPEFGDRRIGDGFQKHSYPLGIVVNTHGERFVDEGADFRNYTYAKYGREILRQPHQTAWQIFDGRVAHLLRDEYRIREASKFTGQTLEELAAQLDGIDPQGFLNTVKQFNASVDQSKDFDPNVRDGRATDGLPVPKSNWANPLDTPPYEAYAVTCGVTFTFGGLRVTPDAQVVDDAGDPIPGLFSTGEMVGGLFFHNYPGGTGLTAGAVFGRIAGQKAAASRTGT